ncbi:MFS transporter [Microcoleus sp. C2C3]|uniref:MFS transporter n=1 Tax=unclassified Microcoleus TaxID=2642155 RepID=UPI002FD61376
MSSNLSENRLSLAVTLILVSVIFLSSLGDEIAMVAFIFKVERASSSGLSISMLLAAQLVPGILLSPFSGQIIDRIETTRVLVITLILQGLLLCLLATTNSVILIVSGAALLGSLFAVSGPALFTLLPVIIKNSESAIAKTAWANTVIEITQRFGSLIGPILGGIIVAQAASTSIAFLIDAATFLIAAPVIWFSGIRRRFIGEGKSQSRKILEGVFAGIQVLWEERILRVVIPVFIIVMFASSISDVAFIFFVRRYLEGNSITYGILVAVWTGGIICGALAGGTSFVEKRLELFSMLGATLIGISLGVSGIFPKLAVVVTMFVAGGIANGLFNVTVRNLLYKYVLEQMHGRAFAAYLALRNASIITGYVAGGSFAAESSRTLYIISGTLGTVVGIFGVVLILLYSRIWKPTQPAESKLD